MSDDGSRSLLLHNGRIYSSASAPDPVEALLIEAGRVRWIGDASKINPAPNERLDLGGRTVLPGLIDAHLHLEQYAHRLDMLDCELPSKAECLEAVRRACAATEPGAWVLGHGWNQNPWGEYGSAVELDQVAPHNPIYLTAKSLHAAWVNSAALRLAGVDQDTPDPQGGALQRDEHGAPTGILFEHAMQLVSDVVPKPTVEQLSEMLEVAQQRLLGHGLTGVHDFDGPRCLTALQLLRERGSLRLRVVKNVPAEALHHYSEAGLRGGFGDHWIRLGNVKAFADGALGPRTAAMLGPYLDEPDNSGILLMDGEAVSELGIEAAQAGFAIAVHAIGDRANHEVLNGISTVRDYEARQRLPARRHRIEHLQLLHPDDLDRPAELAVVASMQPIHATSDMVAADRAWGERTAGAYAWHSQLGARARLAFGSDAPVEDPNPFLGLHAAITRRRLNDGSTDQPAWIPSQRVQLAGALGAFTEGPAFAGGMEMQQGQLSPGFLADLIVLEQDPFGLAPEQVATLSPVGVMVDGSWKLREF